MYICRLTGRTNVAAFAFLLDERKENVRVALEKFAEIYSNKLPHHFFVDKDFDQRDLLIELFKSCEIHYCSFHVLSGSIRHVSILNIQFNSTIDI